MDDKLMDERKELNEILLGGDLPKDSSKGKKIILMLVIAIIVIAILLVVFYKMTREDDKDPILLTEPSIEKLDSLHNSDSSFEMGSEEFENLPIDNMSNIGTGIQDDPNKAEDEGKFDKIVQDIKAKQLVSEQRQALSAGENASADRKDLTKGVTKDKIPTQAGTTSSTRPVKVDSFSTKPPVETQVKTVSRQPKTLEKPKVTKVLASKNGSLASHGYYLQVGAFSKKPNQFFLNKIAKYNYRIQTSTIGGQIVTKYLIGPYSSKTEASRDVLRVTTEIGKPLHIEVK